jgi:hypothetical protein
MHQPHQGTYTEGLQLAGLCTPHTLLSITDKNADRRVPAYLQEEASHTKTDWASKKAAGNGPHAQRSNTSPTLLQSCCPGYRLALWF